MTNSKYRFIAILGFSKIYKIKNISLIRYVSAELVRHNLGICCGNFTGTFHHAFSSAKLNNGRTKLIIEKNIDTKFNNLYDSTITTSSSIAKHSEIASRCFGAIAFGGGNGTIDIINYFLNLDKPVVAIMNTGGIVPNELDTRVEIAKDYRFAANRFISK